MRFFSYSHDELGLGHTRRHRVVSATLTDLAPDASVLLASGAAFERLGLLRLVKPDPLLVERSRPAVSAAVGTFRRQLPERANALLRFDGAGQAAAELLALAADRENRALVPAAAEGVAG
jgi:hypothetical protein